MIINFYWLNEMNLKIKFMLKYLVFLTIKWLVQTKIVIGGLAHVPVLIFIVNFIKGKFGIKTEKSKDSVVKGEPVKIIEVKDTVVKEGKAEAIKEISNKLDSI